MASSIKGQSVVDINAPIPRNYEIMNDLLAMYGLCGCDIVATYHGIGKTVALRVLSGQKHSVVYLEILKCS
jgi:hypothetical protein